MDIKRKHARVTDPDFKVPPITDLYNPEQSRVTTEVRRARKERQLKRSKTDLDPKNGKHQWRLGKTIVKANTKSEARAKLKTKLGVPSLSGSPVKV